MRHTRPGGAAAGGIHQPHAGQLVAGHSQPRGSKRGSTRMAAGHRPAAIARRHAAAGGAQEEGALWPLRCAPPAACFSAASPVRCVLVIASTAGLRVAQLMRLPHCSPSNLHGSGCHKAALGRQRGHTTCIPGLLLCVPTSRCGMLSAAQVSPHRKGKRSANKFIRFVPVVAQCSKASLGMGWRWRGGPVRPGKSQQVCPRRSSVAAASGPLVAGRQLRWCDMMVRPIQAAHLAALTLLRPGSEPSLPAAVRPRVPAALHAQQVRGGRLPCGKMQLG